MSFSRDCWSNPLPDGPACFCFFWAAGLVSRVFFEAWLLCTGRRGLLNLVSFRCLLSYFELFYLSAYEASLQAGRELFYLSASLQDGMFHNCSGSLGTSVTVGSGQCRFRKWGCQSLRDLDNDCFLFLQSANL